MIFGQAGSQIVADHFVLKGGAIGARGHDKGRGTALDIVDIGAVTNDCRCALSEGSSEEVPIGFPQVDSVEKDAWIGHGLVTVFWKSYREGPERGIPESVSWWGRRGQGTGVD